MRVILRDQRPERPHSKVSLPLGDTGSAPRWRRLFSFVVSVSLHAGAVAAVLGIVSLFSPDHSPTSRRKATVMVIRLPQGANQGGGIDYIPRMARPAAQLVAPTRISQRVMPLDEQPSRRQSTIASARPRVSSTQPVMLIDVPQIASRDFTPADLSSRSVSTNPLPSLFGILSAGPGREPWQPDSLVKLEHPAGGQFDVVLVQTSLADVVPESAGLMNSQPVYTVYIHVGDTKEWIMHYCATDTAIVQRGPIVQLPDPRPLKAPYPQLTFRLREPMVGSGPNIFVHGTIDENGFFQNLRVLGQLEQQQEILLKAMSHWRFRPASRADSPARVEVLLAIPATGT